MEMQMANTANSRSFSTIKNTTAALTPGAVMDSFGAQRRTTLILMPNTDSAPTNVSAVLKVRALKGVS